jgi:death-on-curing protein
MISVQQALRVHTIAIEKFGGADGVRDADGLQSALARPFQTFDAIDLYSTIFEKAAAIGESIIINHPFVDGNKRTGYLLMEALLRIEGYVINSSDDDLYGFVINISTGALSFDEIVDWLKANTASENR